LYHAVKGSHDRNAVTDLSHGIAELVVVVGSGVEAADVFAIAPAFDALFQRNRATVTQSAFHRVRLEDAAGSVSAQINESHRRLQPPFIIFEAELSVAIVAPAFDLVIRDKTAQMCASHHLEGGHCRHAQCHHTKKDVRHRLFVIWKLIGLICSN